ncbi:MAG TPA: TIGR01212 family radical SAM protein [bacterium]|nr:TIGR01212 family radical SAM protein [bacterium]HOC24099.1 TIGR01212 family radical SAM protein [bacterium]HOH05904.1 TIGR01212 family radical SAM protein [bacterium]
MAEPIERYRSFSGYLRERYGGRVWKIPVDAGLSCPNRDGTISRGGCIYCRLESFSRMQSRLDIGLTEQIEAGIRNAQTRQGADKFIIYFQSSSNTRAPVEHLRALYERALSFPGVVGLDIATRPDLLGEEVLALLAGMAERTDLWIELGLQSSHDQTLRAINRGHTYGDYLTAIASLRALPLRICTHLILGLPGEDAAMMLATADAIAASPVHEIKLHPLLILTDTVLAEWHRQGQVRELAPAEYAALAADFIERMPEEMVMQRLTAEAPAEMLIAPRWALAKHKVRRAIEEELVRRDSWQGKCRRL